MISIINQTHTSKDGDTILISQMSDQHLLNVIRLYALRAEKCLQSLENANTLPGALGHTMRSDSERIRKELLESLNYNLNAMGCYVFDAARRGLDVSVLLQRATGIKGVVPINGLSKLPTSSDEDDCDDEDSYDSSSYYESNDFYNELYAD